MSRTEAREGFSKISLALIAGAYAGTGILSQPGKEKEMKGKKRKIVQFFAGAAVFGFLLGGCASNGTLSTQKISAGDRAIMDAKVSNASLNAPADLNVAEGKLNQARDAFAQKEYEQAVVDAEYARANASTAKTKKTVEEMRKNIDALRQEIERLSK
jgi:major membrane immunogen (membrane-anchored lipoprotein)